MPRYYLATDLKEDKALIQEYIRYHENVWQDIKLSIRESGITQMEIFHFGNRLFMVIEAGPDFSFERKADLDWSNPIVQEWEELMLRFQKPIPGTAPGQKWVLLNKIFDLTHA